MISKITQIILFLCFSLWVVSISGCSSKDEQQDEPQQQKSDGTTYKYEEKTISIQNQPSKTCLQNTGTTQNKETGMTFAKNNQPADEQKTAPLAETSTVNHPVQPYIANESADDPKLHHPDQELITIPHICSALKSEDEYIREEAVYPLAFVNDPQAGELIVEALNDSSEFVRTAALEVATEYDESTANAALKTAIYSALKSEDEYIREEAVYSLAFVNDHQVGELIVEALNDSSEFVRTAALEVATEHDENTANVVFKAAICSPYKQTKEEAVSILMDSSSPKAMDILISGLKDADSEFRDEVSMAIDFLISKEFNDYEKAKNWWNSNRNKYGQDFSQIVQ